MATKMIALRFNRQWIHPRLGNLALATTGLTLALLLGAFIAMAPLVAVVPLVLIMFVGIVQSSYVRFLTVTAGGILVFQSSDGLSTPKLAYLAAMLLSTGIASRTALTKRRPEHCAVLDNVVKFSFVGLCLLPCSLLIGLAHSSTVTSWLRDSISYILLLTAPIMAIDVQRGRSARFIPGTFIAIGLLSAVATAVGWASRRGYSQLPLDHLVLPSNWPAYAVAFAAFAIYLNGGHNKTKWLVVLGAIVGIGTISGSRSIFAPYLGFAFVAFAQRHDLRKRAARSLGVFAGLVVALALTALVISQLSIVDVRGLEARYSNVGAVVANRNQDASYGERAIQTDLAWRTFRAAPFMGVGLGYSFHVWRPTSSKYTTSLSIDTAVVLLTKLGLVGFLYTLGLTISYGRVIHAFRRLGARISADILLLWGVASLISVPFTAFFEDKGYVLGMSLVFAFALYRANETLSNASQPVRP